MILLNNFIYHNYQTYFINSQIVQFMKPQTTIAQQIIESNDITKAKQMLLTLSANNQFSTLLQQLQEILLNQHNHLKQSDTTVFKINLIEEIFSYAPTIKTNSFKVKSIFHLISITKGYLRRNHQKDKLRSIFIKSLLKSQEFWGLSNLQAFRNNLVDKSAGYRPLLTQYLRIQQLEKIKYLITFYEENTVFFPPNIDIRYYIFKYMLMIRNQTQPEKNLYQTLRKIFFSSPYHPQIVTKNFRFCLQFFRNSFNEKDILYYPQKNIVNILSQYKKYEIQQLIVGCSLGLIWRYEQLSCCIINCIKLGITENTSRIILAFVQLGKNNNKFNQTIKVFQQNIAKLFIFMKHPKLFPTSFNLLKQFIIGPPPTTTLYNTFIEKAIAFLNIVSKQNHTQFVSLLQVVKFKYQQTSIVTQIQKTIEKQVKNGYQNLEVDEIKKIVNEYDWNLFNKKDIKSVIKNNDKKEELKYKGLVNIGNSCYMNSFIQSLFMTRQFKKQLLKTSPLTLQQSLLGKLHQKYKNDKNIQIPTLARQAVRPVAQLQRLFGLLIKSQRPAIAPTAFKTAGPIQFRNNFQQDVTQYGRSLFQSLHQSSFPQFFEGQQTTEIQCSHCNEKRYNKEQFVDLILWNEKDNQSLEQMVQRALASEEVPGLICDKCNTTSQKSFKRHKISKMPNYLILSMKRFQYNIEDKKNKKIHFKVQMDEIFNIQKQQFMIYSIIIHRGPSANSGHYFNFSRQNLKQQSNWICFNDSEVDILASFEKVKQFLDNCPEDTPYIIFAQKIQHIKQNIKQLQEPIILRPATQSFIEKDNIEYAKSLNKTTSIIDFKNFKLNFFQKRDSDSDEDNGQNKGINFNTPIL